VTLELTPVDAIVGVPLINPVDELSVSHEPVI
jgi:hypothetical protein